ncbi:MAG: type III pantothenate kinase [Anaeroplasmataceae bacterium]
MILVVDMGNTNIVFGVLDKTNVVFSGRIGTDRSKMTIDFLMSFKTLLEFYNIKPDSLDGGILSSVVPELTYMVKDAMEMIIKKEVLVVGAGIKTGLNIKIDDPKTLGADRVADAVAAIEEYKAPMIIIDMGTATTISVIDKSKCHIGGMIIPGVLTSLNALSSKASQIPSISLTEPKNLIGKNTVECMKSGIVYGNASMIDGLINKIKADMGEDISVIVTGGLSKFIIPHCENKMIYEENLLLKGLYYIYQKNI